MSQIKINRTLLAAVIGLCAASAADAAVVYDKDDTSLNIGGRVAANVNSVFATHDYDPESNSNKVELEGDARLSVDAKARIYDGVRAKAFAEWDVASESSENGQFDVRYAYLGFDTDKFGSLVFGQSESAIYAVTGITDVFIDWGFSGSTTGDLADCGRQEGQIIYSIDGLWGFSFGASYQTAGLDGVSSGAAFSAGYTFNEETFPIYVGAGYDTYKADYDENFPGEYQNVSELFSKLSRDSFAAGVSAGDQDDGLYAAATYQLTRYAAHDGYNVKDTNSYEVAVGWADASLGYALLAAYENRKSSNLTFVSDVVFEGKYNFNENFLTYVEAQFATGDVDDQFVGGAKYSVDGHDKVSVGLIYDF